MTLTSNIAAFRATHRVAVDHSAWEHMLPSTRGLVFAVHVYRDHSGSPFVMAEKISVFPGPAWFEYAGSPERYATRERAESALFYDLVEERAAA